jgi:hypothetical protein
MAADEEYGAWGFGEAYRRDDAAEEPQTAGEKLAWYEGVWNEAQVLARESRQWDEPGQGDPDVAVAADADAGLPDWVTDP